MSITMTLPLASTTLLNHHYFFSCVSLQVRIRGQNVDASGNDDAVS